MSELPHDKRRGWLKNGNAPGDYSKAPRCGARNRRGSSCGCPAMRNRKRCRLHGGKSTGPRTAEGLERMRAAVTKTGFYSAQLKAERRQARQAIRQLRTMMVAYRPLLAQT
jgi:hypothetical protein